MSNTCAVTVTLGPSGSAGGDFDWDKLHVVALEGIEGISRQFEFYIQVYYTGSGELDVLLHEPVTLTLDYSEQYQRNVNGIISAAEYSETITDRTDQPVHVYHLALVPKVWKLNHRTNCRVFYDESVQEILDRVLKESGVLTTSEYDTNLSGGTGAAELRWPGGPRDEAGLRAQYRETDWAFLCRIMEEFGIFYYFEHTASGHKLRLGNRTSHYGTCVPELVSYKDATGGSTFRIYPFRHKKQIVPGKVTLKDFNEAYPSRPLVHEATPSGGAGDEANLTLRDHPGGYPDATQGDGMAALRLAEARNPQIEAGGESDCIGLVPGHVFALTNCEGRRALEQDYLVLGVRHRAHNEDPDARYKEHSLRYQNSFRCQPKTTLFRPQRVTPRPSVRGVQTATVVAHDNTSTGEPCLDQSGRVKVRFHWQQSTAYAWVRVAQSFGMSTSATRDRGVMHWPRVGDEVLVEFVEGDPDRPLVTGTVYTTSLSAGVKYAPYIATDDPDLTVLKQGNDTQSKIWTDAAACSSPPEKTKTSQPGPTLVPGVSGGMNTDFLSYVMNAAGQNLPLSNAHRNVTKDGANEITLHDDGTSRALLIRARKNADGSDQAVGTASTDAANLYTDADYHHEKAGWHYQQIAHGSRSYIGGDPASVGPDSAKGKKQFVNGPYHLYCSSDHRVEVGGNVISYIGGNTYLTNDAKTYNWGKTQDYHYADSYEEQHGDSESYKSGNDFAAVHGNTTTHHFGINSAMHLGMDNGFFLGMKNSLTIAGCFEANIAGGINIDIGALKATLELSALTFTYSGSLLTLAINGSSAEIEMHHGIKIDIENGITLEKENIKVEGKTVKVEHDEIELTKLGTSLLSPTLRLLV